ncbi:MAG TPA: TetR/AcrR family transcriptional regulator [Mycobacteriales bacterium]|jgi:AcrR family transcriptional regulator|nr:TetR/AcrR family transcriptional regulator [Mycobacteriales bacterium]
MSPQGAVADSNDRTVDPRTSSPRRPGRPRSEQAEQSALQATLELLAEHGVHGFGIETVASAAGIAKTTVYRRWPNKNELILDAMVHLKGRPMRAPGESVRGDLVAMLKRMRKRFPNDLGSRIMPRLMAERECCPELVTQFRDRVVTPRREVVYGILRRGIAEGLIRADVDLELATDMLSAPMLVCHLSRADTYTDEDLGRIVDTILVGVAPRSE